jgi:phage N-6-adenine-methyltransferase
LNRSSLRVIFSSKSDEHPTPDSVFAPLNEEFGFALDVCATKRNAKCPRFLTKADDALAFEDWTHAHVKGPRGPGWMNPPYGTTEKACERDCEKKRCKERGWHRKATYWGIDHWIAKAHVTAEHGRTMVCLLPSRTDTAWWHDHVLAPRVEIRYVRGRIKFGTAENTAPFPSAIVIFRPPPLALVNVPCPKNQPLPSSKTIKHATCPPPPMIVAA